MSERNFVPTIMPQLSDVRRAIDIQTKHQQAIRSRSEYVLDPRMTCDETFSAFESSNIFANFIRTVNTSYYCPPAEWPEFHKAMMGWFNELLTEDILVGQTRGRGKVLLDSNHSRPIIESLYPGSYAKEYGIDQTSLRSGKTLLPSSDFILIENNNLGFLCEASAAHEDVNRQNIGYWQYKRDRAQGVIEAFNNISEFNGMFADTHCHLAMNWQAYNNRKRLLGSIRSTQFTRLPYSRRELKKYFNGAILPNEPPSSLSLTSAEEAPHWTQLLEVSPIHQPLMVGV